MTEKRFYHKDLLYMSINETLDLLNSLSEENEQLKSEIHLLNIEMVKTKSYEQLEKELNRFKKKNEKLKRENYELHKRLGDFEPFEEHIKERTSKTSVNDIIGLVKTDERTNSVELKKELYK